MTTQTIEWYQKANENVKKHIDGKRLRLKELNEEITRAFKNWEFRERQIVEAIKRGKKSFDEERFLISKKGESHGK